MMGHKIKLKNSLEEDAIRGRKQVCYTFNNHKLVKFVKRTINKRIRKTAKQELKYV